MDYTVAGKCTVDGKDNKEDKTREEADFSFWKASKLSGQPFQFFWPETPNKITFFT